MTDITRRKFIATTATGSSLLLSGCMNSTSYGKGHPVPDNKVTNVQIPSSPENYTYPLMGSGDASVTIYYFGSFKCPFCAQFSTSVLPDIVTDYISSGNVNLQYRSLVYINNRRFLGQDAPRIGNADLAVWDYDPDQYWTFHEYVYQNQPPESKTWGSKQNLMNFVKGANVDNTSKIETAIQKMSYESALQKTAQTASGLGVQGTPTLYIGDKLVNGLQKNAVYNAIDEALQN